MTLPGGMARRSHLVGDPCDPDTAQIMTLGLRVAGGDSIDRYVVTNSYCQSFEAIDEFVLLDHQRWK
jgi:hypothetical protein